MTRKRTHSEYGISLPLGQGCVAAFAPTQIAGRAQNMHSRIEVGQTLCHGPEGVIFGVVADDDEPAEG